MNRRKSKLVRWDIQFRVVFITLFTAVFVLLVNFQLVLTALWSLSAKLMTAVTMTVDLEQVRAIVTRKFFVSAGIAIPLAVSVGILYSFTFSGPLYRFKKYFQDLILGRWDQRCKLRENDYLQDVSDSINGAVDVFRERLRVHNELLQDVSTFLNEAVITADSGTQQAARSLKERVGAELDICLQRLPWVDAAGSKKTEEHVEEPAQAPALQ